MTNHDDVPASTRRRPRPGLALGERAYLDRLRPVVSLNPLAPSGLGDLIHHCLSYHPEGRPESMKAVCRALARLVDELEATGE